MNSTKQNVRFMFIWLKDITPWSSFRFCICFSIEMTYLLLATLNNILYQSKYLICLVNGFQGNNPRLNTIRLAKMGNNIHVSLWNTIKIWIKSFDFKNLHRTHSPSTYENDKICYDYRILILAAFPFSTKHYQLHCMLQKKTSWLVSRKI